MGGELTHERMQLRSLGIIVYDETGWNWYRDTIQHPKWEEVEDSIRNPDQFCHPWIELHLSDEPEGFQETLVVMGGKGVFWVSLTAGEYDQLRLHDPEKSNREVELWTSDQGFSDCEFHTSTDLDLILTVARYFAEEGLPLSSVTWERDL